MDKILEELKRNETDKLKSDKELEIDKMKFIEEIKQYDFSCIEKPLKRKLPLTIRIRRFINKLSKVFSNE